jgi:hypothetical protein
MGKQKNENKKQSIAQIGKKKEKKLII